MTLLSTTLPAPAERARLLARELWRAQRTRALPVQYPQVVLEALVQQVGAEKMTAQMHVVLDRLERGEVPSAIIATL